MKKNIFRILGSIKSFNEVSITTKFPEKIMNMLQNQNVGMWDVLYCNETLTFKTFSDSIEIVRRAAQMFGDSVETVKKMGFEKFTEELKRRKFFYFISAFAFLLIMLISGCVWRINIYCARETNKQDILNYLYSQNIRQSVSRRKINEKEISVGILQNFSGIREAVVELKGISLNITLIESHAPLVMYDKDIPVDIVAAEDASVYKIDVYNGTQVATEGAYVRKGDVLISGRVEYESEEKNEVRYVHAIGKVLTYNEETMSNIVIESMLPKENAPYEAERTYYIFGKSVSINNLKESRGGFVKEYACVPVEFAGIQLPVLYDEKRWYNITDCENKSEDAIAKEVYAEVVSRLDKRCVVESVTYNATFSENGRLLVDAHVKYTKNIAAEQQIKQ